MNKRCFFTVIQSDYSHFSNCRHLGLEQRTNEIARSSIVWIVGCLVAAGSYLIHVMLEEVLLLLTPLSDYFCFCTFILSVVFLSLSRADLLQRSTRAPVIIIALQERREGEEEEKSVSIIIITLFLYPILSTQSN